MRQLAYDFRPWASIEAIGRSGSDEGVDIRAIERRHAPGETDDSDTPESVERTGQWEERLWTVQCKREKTIPPVKARKIARELMSADGTPPYGFLLAAATDLSLKARNAAREVLRSRGVEEIVIWGKAELEDLLFQPKNDHLLFAYFGISLQTRRRSARNLLGARLTTKRRLVKLLGELGHESPEPVLLRDAKSTEYPQPADPTAFKRDPKWRYYRFAGHLRPDHLAFVVQEFWAWANFEKGYFDYVEQFDQGLPRYPQVAFGSTGEGSEYDLEEKARRFWLTRVPQAERANLRVLGFIHYDRVLVIDDFGDLYNASPHILVDCLTPDALFQDRRTVVESGYGYDSQQLVPEKAERRTLFPAVFPDITNEEFEAAIRKGS